MRLESELDMQYVQDQAWVKSHLWVYKRFMKENCCSQHIWMCSGQPSSWNFKNLCCYRMFWLPLILKLFLLVWCCLGSYRHSNCLTRHILLEGRTITMLCRFTSFCSRPLLQAAWQRPPAIVIVLLTMCAAPLILQITKSLLIPSLFQPFLCFFI